MGVLGRLLAVEGQMAEFFDEAAIPPDLKRTKAGVLKRIAEVEAAIQQEAVKCSWTHPTRAFWVSGNEVDPGTSLPQQAWVTFESSGAKRTLAAADEALRRSDRLRLRRRPVRIGVSLQSAEEGRIHHCRVC